MTLSRNHQRLVCAVAVGGTVGLLGIFISRKKRQQRELEERKKKGDEEKRIKDEAEGFRERARIRSRGITNGSMDETLRGQEAATTLTVEEVWKRKQEEHNAKHRLKEEQERIAHEHDAKTNGHLKSEAQAAEESAKAEAEVIAEDLNWQMQEDELIKQDHAVLVGKMVKLYSTGQKAEVVEAIGHCAFSKVALVADLKDATPDTTMWCLTEDVEADAVIGCECMVKTLRRLGHLHKVDDESEFAFQVQFHEGHTDWFRRSDVELKFKPGTAVLVKKLRGYIQGFDGNLCKVGFVAGAIAGETCYLSKDALELVAEEGCHMYVKSRKCRGELIKYDTRAPTWPFMISFEDGSSDWFKCSDAEPWFEEGCCVSVKLAGRLVEITEPPHEHPYQLRLPADAKHKLIWARRRNFSVVSKVGSPVRELTRGRTGTIVLKDESDIPCKVSFDDGQLPATDWLKEDDLMVLDV